jgi:chaperone required for assembly of F1-ATPase
MVRDLFEDIYRNEPLDPVGAVRRGMQPALRRRFYNTVTVAEEGESGFHLALDGRPVRTPARHALAAPSRAIAEAIASEWRTQGDFIDPRTMPLTRLANAIIDGVAHAPARVAAEAEKYLASDLVFYRAADPEGLVARQSQAWDPLLDWARDAFGARFMLAQALVFVAQPEAALAAMRAAIPRDAWRLGAFYSIVTLTGSFLIALAVLHGRLSIEAAWDAAHVDEDWNMDFWGRDELALQRRAARFCEAQAAAKVLALLRD